MNNLYDILYSLNCDNYENCIFAHSEDDIITSMVWYFDGYDLFDDIINIDEDDFKDEYGDIDELAIINEKEKQKKEYINSLIKWEGVGEYCLAGHSFGNPSIMKVDSLLISELEDKEFPIPFDMELFKNSKEYISNWKKSEGYKYIYFVTFVKHIGIPSYNINYVVYSNNKIDNVIETLYQDKGIFIGEFNSLGSNHIVEEVEDFDIDYLTRYTFTEYENIYLD